MRRTTSCGTSRLISRVPRVWRHWCGVSWTGLAVLVADIAAGQPAVEREPVGRGGGRGPAVGVLRRPREQHRCAVATDAVLLFDDQGVEFFVDRDQRLAFHLVVEVAQVGGAVGVEDDAVARQRSARR